MVYSVGFKHQVLDLNDRLRGLAVCHAWLSALSYLPIPTITFYFSESWSCWDKRPYDTGKVCQWIILKQPTVTEVYQESQVELGNHAIHSLQRQGLLKLTWGQSAVEIAQGLPMPAMFPNLQHLDVQQTLKTTDWLAGLGALSNLESLKLNFELNWQDTATAPVQLPPLARLTFLKLDLNEFTQAQLSLADLPALAELTLEGYGKAALLTSGPAPQLRHLTCLMRQLSVDFSALPGLTSAGLKSGIHLGHAAGIAGASALTRLELLDCYEWEREPSPSRAMLASLPPSVNCLHVAGKWCTDTAMLVGELPGLVALSLEYGDPESRLSGKEAPMPPARASLWTRLRALSWLADPEYDKHGGAMIISTEFNLPQALQRASRLVALQANLIAPSVLDLDLIASLPALRKLNFPLERWEAADVHGTAGRRLLRQALSHVALQERTDLREPVEFLKWALD